MTLLEQVQRDVREALRAGDRERVRALRMVANELQRAAKETGAEDAEVLRRERKRRLESAAAYREAGRAGQAADEEREAEIVASYLPEQLSDEELEAIVGDAVAETGATSPGELGKVMSVAMPRVGDRAEGARVSRVVREKLAS